MSHIRREDKMEDQIVDLKRLLEKVRGEEERRRGAEEGKRGGKGRGEEGRRRGL